jgi:hypothetical protein
MRYVVTDLAGNQRASFESSAELFAELREGGADDPTMLESLYVLVYDDDGNELASARRADELLAGATLSGQVWTLMFDFVHRTVRPVSSPETDPAYRELRERAGAALVGQGA